MGGCQNYGPFFGYPESSVPYYNRDPERDHNFDNHPNETWKMKRKLGEMCFMAYIFKILHDPKYRLPWDW